MSLEAGFACDSEFTKLLAHRTDVDPTTAALELARDAYPDLDFAETFQWIDEVGDALRKPLARATTDREAVATLGECIAGHHGITGDADSFGDPDTSYLNRVIACRRGIPISLSLLYMAIGARAGINLHGVCAPRHFLTRYEAIDGPLFVDAFAGGRVLAYDECVERLCKTIGLSSSRAEAFLEPVDSRPIVIRMLNNLKAIYAGQSNWPAAWVVQHRLTLLQPGAYHERRDLGLISLKADRPGQAIDLLESCLQTGPAQDASMLAKHLEEAQRRMVGWN